MIFRMSVMACVAACAGLSSLALANPTAIDGEEPDMFEDTYTFVCPDGGYESGCTREDVALAVMLDEEPRDVLASECLYRTQADCSVVANGHIAALTPGTTLHWQLLALQPIDGPAIEMMVLFEQDGAVSNLLVSHQSEGYFDPPVAVRDGDERFILHVPARNRGLGNADLILMESGGGWNWWTADQLIADANRLLPAGFTLSSPVQFNLREGSAFALVRRESDAGCCATGGVAIVDFDVSRPHSIAIAGVSFQQTTPGELRRIGPDGETGDSE